MSEMNDTVPSMLFRTSHSWFHWSPPPPPPHCHVQTCALSLVSESLSSTQRPRLISPHTGCLLLSSSIVGAPAMTSTKSHRCDVHGAGPLACAGTATAATVATAAIAVAPTVSALQRFSL